MTIAPPTTPSRSGEVLLSVRDLRAVFRTDDGVVQAADGVSFDVHRGEVFAIVGESGSGKSVTAMTILGLVPSVQVEHGEILWKGRDLLAVSDEERRAVRGGEIAMVFQDPLTALNPVHTVGRQIGEMARIHEGLNRKAAFERAVEMLALVGIPEARKRAAMYPHEFSGGMRQRAMIAMAIACKPDLLIADEPTTALDVTIQAQILELLADLQKRFGTSILLITHDMGVVAETASRVIVMYGGEIVEQAPVDRIFANPHHPYTEGLLGAMPRVGQERERLQTIPGTVPPPTHWPSGCRFHDRCAYAWERTEKEHPPLYEVEPKHFSRCHLAQEPQRRLQPHDPLVVQQGASP